MRIRSDLVGVVYVESLVLRAGDTIPDGVTVGDHLLEPEAGPEDPESDTDGEAADVDPDGSEAPALEGSEPVDGEAQLPESTPMPPAPELEPKPVSDPAPKPKPHTKG